MRSTSLDETSLRLLLDAGRSLVAESGLEPLLERVLQTAQELTGAGFAALGILDERRAGLERFLTRGIDETSRATIGAPPDGHGILGIPLDDPRPLRLDDVRLHPRFVGFPADHPPMRSFLGAPILIRGEVWGTLYLTDDVDGQFSPADEEVAVVLADWAAVAIDNARLVEREASRRREFERVIGAFEASAKITRVIGGETDVERILELIVEHGRVLVEASVMLVLLREGEHLVVAAAAGELDEAAAIGRSVGVDDPVFSRVLGGGPPLLIMEIDRRSRSFAVDLAVPDAESALIVPLVHRGLGVGVLAAFDRIVDGPQFTPHDARLAGGFSAGAAAAVGTAQTAERERVRQSLESAERERARWARELHDATLQSLGALRLGLTTLRHQDDRAAVDEVIAYTIEHLGQEMTHLRALITDLRPTALDDSGVPAALAALVARAKALYEIEVSLAVDLDFEAGRSDTRPAPELETAICRTVQEALTNVGKHAGAASATVDVREHEGTITIVIADDGHGFDPAAASDGFGTIGMQERAALANGHLEIVSAATGTTVTSVLPSADRGSSGVRRRSAPRP